MATNSWDEGNRLLYSRSLGAGMQLDPGTYWITGGIELQITSEAYWSFADCFFEEWVQRSILAYAEQPTFAHVLPPKQSAVAVSRTK